MVALAERVLQHASRAWCMSSVHAPVEVAVARLTGNVDTDVDTG
jgi:hypothetical protein